MRWVKWSGIGLVVLIVALFAIVYGGSEYVIRRHRGAPLGHVVADASPAGLAEGEHIARINGCYSCHGTSGHGRVMANVPPVFVITAPALANFAGYSDGELARSIRNSVGRHGNALWIMPSHLRMADSDLAMLMGHLHSLKPDPADIERKRSFGPIGRALILAGKITPETALGDLAPKTKPADLGRYMVETVCSGCHALDRPMPFEDGGPRPQTAPPLAMMGAAYDDAVFVRLLRTGQGLKPGDLGIMTVVGREAGHYLRDDEIAAIHAYLRKKAAELPPG